jgi:hypothetical protein
VLLGSYRVDNNQVSASETIIDERGWERWSKRRVARPISSHLLLTFTTTVAGQAVNVSRVAESESPDGAGIPEQRMPPRDPMGQRRRQHWHAVGAGHLDWLGSVAGGHLTIQLAQFRTSRDHSLRLNPDHFSSLAPSPPTSS